VSPDDNGTRWRPGKWVWGGFALALLVLLYVIAGYTIVPGLVRAQAQSWVKTNIEKDLALGEIKFNPFTFTLEVSDIALPAGPRPMVAAGHLKVSFSPLSLFQEAYYFPEVRLDRPFVHAVLRPDHSLNLIELKPRTQSDEPAPKVRIGALSVAGGRIAYADESRTPRLEKTLTPITFTLANFQTNRAEGGAFTLDARSERGEDFAWKGDISIAPVASRGQLTVTGLRATTVQDFAGDYLPVALTGGGIGFDLRYDFSYAQNGPRFSMQAPSIALRDMALDGKTLFRGTATLADLKAAIGRFEIAGQMRASVPQAHIQGLKISPSGPGQAVTLESAAMKDAALDGAARKLTIASLAVSGADVPLRRERNGRISLMSLMPDKRAPAAPPATVQAPWSIALGALSLEKASVRFEDRAVSPTVRLNVSPINLSVTGAGSDLNTALPFQLQANVDGKASIGAQGTITPSSGVLDASVTIARLALRPLSSYLPPHPALDLKSGSLNAAGTLHMEGKDIAAARFTGNAAVNDLRLYETGANSELFAWRSLALNAISYRAQNLTIGRARLTRPFGRIAVMPDRSFNFQSLTGAKVPVEQVAGQVGLPPAPRATPAAPPVRVRLRRLDIAGGIMSFADYSMQPNFEARIDALQGTISNLSSQPTDPAAFDLKGQVIDQYSPVSITGSMNLAGYDRQTDMRLTFRNIELPVFNPYSGRYAGYAIAKGKLTTELSYKIVNRALQADHHIVIDQLEWGQATNSKEAVPLPVRLAASLLKDRHGVIDLKLPLTGSLDDPKFRIWPIVWQIVGNIIEKAITAPFSLIGSLFEGAEKAQYVDFAPGAATLPAGSGEALGALAKALTERTELQLDIPAAPGIQEDAFALADVEIDKQAMGDDAAKGFASLDADDQHDDLEDLYESKLGKDPAYPEFSPEALKAVSGNADLDEDDRRQLLETQWLRAQLRTAFAPSGAQLAALGTARAQAIRNALLADGKVDPARIFTATALKATAAGGHTRVELKIK
jgi:uncharacterized protein involved in outer membrane biogenesis